MRTVRGGFHIYECYLQDSEGRGGKLTEEGGRVDTSLKPFGGVSVHLFLEESGLGWSGVFFSRFLLWIFYPKAWGDFPL